MKISILQRRVKKGIKYLNEVKPGWHKKINLDILSLSNERVCICGQIFENFFNVILASDNSFGRATPRKKISMTMKQAVSKGFVLDGDGGSYDTLTRIWYIEISKLLEN